MKWIVHFLQPHSVSKCLSDLTLKIITLKADLLGFVLITFEKIFPDPALILLRSLKHFYIDRTQLLLTPKLIFKLLLNPLVRRRSHFSFLHHPLTLSQLSSPPSPELEEGIKAVDDH